MLKGSTIARKKRKKKLSCVLSQQAFNVKIFNNAITQSNKLIKDSLRATNRTHRN